MFLTDRVLELQPDPGDLSIVSEQAVPPPPGQRQGRQGPSRSAMKSKGEKDAKKVNIKVTNTPIPWSVNPSGGNDPSMPKQEVSTMVEATSQVKCNRQDCIRCVWLLFKLIIASILLTGFNFNTPNQNCLGYFSFYVLLNKPWID